jgi:hypothetical protein
LILFKKLRQREILYPKLKTKAGEFYSANDISKLPKKKRDELVILPETFRRLDEDFGIQQNINKSQKETIERLEKIIMDKQKTIDRLKNITVNCICDSLSATDKPRKKCGYAVPNRNEK